MRAIHKDNAPTVPKTDQSLSSLFFELGSSGFGGMPEQQSICKNPSPHGAGHNDVARRVAHYLDRPVVRATYLIAVAVDPRFGHGGFGRLRPERNQATNA